MNKWLRGNGYWCATCRGTGRGVARDRIIYTSGNYCQFYDPCRACGGAKRMAATFEDICRRTVPETRAPKHHTLFDQNIEYGVARKAQGI